MTEEAATRLVHGKATPEFAGGKAVAFSLRAQGRRGLTRLRAMLKQPEQVQHVLPIQQELFA